jgi:uncharacterized protein (TIGR00304 family)
MILKAGWPPKIPKNSKPKNGHDRKGRNMQLKYLIVVGFLLVFLGMLTIAYGLLRAAGGGRIEGGGVVVIGPFPVAFGTSEALAKAMIVVGIVLAALFAFLLLRAI